MIIWGHYNRDRSEDVGCFDCPQCDLDRDYTLVRTWKYFHVYFIPIAKQELVAERIVCRECNNEFPITILAGTAREIPSAFEAGNGDAQSVSDNFGKIVEFTDAAKEEIFRRHAKSQYDSSVVIRVEPDRSERRAVRISFDYPLADGRDWIGQSNGITVVVDRAVAPELLGSTIDFRDEDFVRT